MGKESVGISSPSDIGPCHKMAKMSADGNLTRPSSVKAVLSRHLALTLRNVPYPRVETPLPVPVETPTFSFLTPDSRENTHAKHPTYKKKLKKNNRAVIPQDFTTNNC